VDLERPSAARVYDYYLGGAHNFAVDRELAEQATRLNPVVPLVARANRAFLRRAVRYLLNQGITQFLDLGSGVPTVGNVHEVAQQALPGARVVYVDNEAVAVAHSREMLADNPDAAILAADLRDPERVLGSPEVAGLLDLSQPLAVLLVSVLHFVPDDDDPAGVVAAYRDATAPGSHLVVSHGTWDRRQDLTEEVQRLYQRSSNPVTLRSRQQVADLFAGYQLVDPGVVHLPQWRPDSLDDVTDHPEDIPGFAAVGRKP
jgi:SAM-dependent methyltransferase